MGGGRLRDITVAEEFENAVLACVAEVLLSAGHSGVDWLDMAPVCSLAWRTVPLLQVWASSEKPTHLARLDWCRFGRPWRQTTQLWSSAAWVSKLARRCR